MRSTSLLPGLAVSLLATTSIYATSLDLHHQRCMAHISWHGLCSAADNHDTDMFFSKVFNSATSPSPDANLVLDTAEDGVLEVMQHVFSEPDPFLLSSDEDDLEAMPRWAMSYTPYTSAGECKEIEDIRDDAATIASKGFTTLRLFSTDCDVLPALKDLASRHSLKLIPTIYIPEDGITDSVHEQLNDLVSFGAWDLISMVAIGNEALFYNYCSSDELAELLASSTNRLRSAGYTGPITTIDHPAMIKLHANLICPHLDVLASSVQPFFDGAIKARDAGRFLAENLHHLSGVCGDVRDSYVLEVGWPRKGRVNGVAVPGKREQRMALQEMLRAAGSRIALATWEDELWREPGEFTAEQFWGCGDLFNATTVR